MKKILFVCGAAQFGALALCSSPAWSQTTSIVGLENVIVTAQKREEPAQKTPISMTVVTSQELKNRSVANLADIQLQTPGLVFEQSTSSQFASNINMRGLTSTGSGESPVGIYIDGVYVSAQNSTGTNTAGFASLIDIDRIEVLKGPQGTLYGRNTTGGAISVVSKLPTQQLEGQITVGAGNYDAEKALGILNAPLIADTLALRMAAQWSMNSGYAHDVVNDVELGRARQRSVRATLLYTPTEQLDIILRGDYADGDGGGGIHQPLTINATSAAEIALENGLPLTPAGIGAAFALYAPYASNKPNLHDKYYDAKPFSSFSSAGSSLTVTYEFNNNLSLNSITAYRHDDFDANEDVDGSPFHLLDARLPGGTKQFTQELQLNGNFFNDTLKATTGIYYYDAEQKDNNSANALVLLLPLTYGASPNPNVNLGDRYDTSKAAYGQVTYYITPNLNITGGLRWTTETKKLTTRSYNGFGCQVPPADQIDGNCRGKYDTSFQNWSHTLGVNYDLAASAMVYAKTSHGFKAGGINTGSAIPGSYAAYDPETVTDYEVGLKSEWLEHRLRLNVAAYRSDYSDLQRTVVIANPSGGLLNLVQNAASARIEGVEFEAAAQPVENLLLQFTAVYVNPRYLDYADLTGDLSHQNFQNQPQWTYSISAGYTLPVAFGNVHAQVDWSWRDEADLFPSGQAADQYRIQDAYGLLNGRLVAEVDTYGIEIAAWGKNLLDERYFTTISDLTSSIGSVVADVGLPRTVGVDFTKRF